MITLEQALDVVDRLIRDSVNSGRQVPDSVILVGGSALAAHGIRAQSEDVDLYMTDFSEDVVFQLEKQLSKRYGKSFKIDVTANENLWGPILVRDIDEDAAEQVSEISIQGKIVSVRALSIETCFLLKLAADREKDRDDLPLLAAESSAAALIERFNVLIKWHGDRGAVAAYADQLLSELEVHYGQDPLQLIEHLDLPQYVKEMLCEARSPQA